ncbi:tetratricopeptide repeat protein [Pseudoroseomonas cervicalis]|uniref:tetratricopeptide repeat protein n=1 Tax=Teichococcus cervicalis TaxID=204525 RepID=UPI0022F19221|nr:tetratricopeptide repeat protein [Pseudoroseomonas cervicalis]WBV45522.1 tetratricopeptide repeat protein [Pseudoroseomonas cervicalis]
MSALLRAARALQQVLEQEAAAARQAALPELHRLIAEKRRAVAALAEAGPPQSEAERAALRAMMQAAEENAMVLGAVAGALEGARPAAQRPGAGRRSRPLRPRRAAPAEAAPHPGRQPRPHRMSGVRQRAAAGPEAEAPAAALQRAVALHRQGALAAAAPLYRALLRSKAVQADAHNLLGLLLCQQGEAAAALPLLRRAVALRPGEAEYHRNLGLALRAAGQKEAALAACRRAVALRPDLAESHFNLGNALEALGQAEAAAAAYAAALQRRPDYAEARLQLGRIRLLLGQVAEAVALLRAAAAARPGCAVAAYNLGLALLAGGAAAEATAVLREALRLGAPEAPARLQLGLALQAERRFAEAAGALRQALALASDTPEGWFSLGLCLQQGEAPEAALEEAEAAFARAVALRPGQADGWFNLALLRRRRGQGEAALAALRQAVALRPQDVGAVTELANLLSEEGWHEAALEMARRAAALAPEDAACWSNLGRTLLTLGHYAEGWDAYARRLREPDHVDRSHGLPEWQGEALPAGEHVLVWREQGVGDEVMFASILPPLLAAGHRLVLLCHPRLWAAFGRAFPGLTLLAEGPPPAGVTRQVSITGLARLFRRQEADFALQRPYLSAEPGLRALLRQRYEPGGGERLLGLSWRSSHPVSGAARSVPLAALAPLARPGWRLVSLQYGAAEALRAEAAEAGLDLLVDERVDARESLELGLAQIAAMDHVVSIDNSAAHFAGALGRPCELLLPRAAEWRWQAARSDSPWYPTLRLWRRAAGEGWSAPVARLAAALRMAEGGEIS